MLTTRRELMAGAGSAALLSRAGFADPGEGPPIYTSAEVDDILADEAEPVSGVKAVISGFWYQMPPGQRPEPGWPEDKEAFDFQHLATVPSPAGPFAITPSTIEEYAAACSVPLEEGAVVLFGLRGAALANGKDWSGAAPQQSIVEARPDHVHPRCVIGVLDRAARTIAVASASTVPGVDLMLVAAQGKGGCNMLPTGYHRYRVGAHRKLRQPAAFRQQNPLWVHRAKGRLTYSLADRENIWDDGDGSLPMDDMHAAVLSYRTEPPFFSSAGCQVVVGAYTRGHQPYGPWADFRKAAGLASPIRVLNGAGASPDDGRRFGYLLLTGKEAGLVATGKAEAIRSLRFGAAGPPVSRLQAALGLHPTASFDRRTMGAVIAWQSAHAHPPSGILTVTQAKQLHVDL